jgi:hypothetical protein
VVLQWLKYDQERYTPIHVERVDPTEQILAYADQHGMKIYLGLWFMSEWWKQWDNADFLTSCARRVIDFAKFEWARYGKHKSVVGWYLPFEIGDNDFEPSELTALNKFLSNLTGSCKKVASRPMQVLTSVFFSQKTPAMAVEQNFDKIFSSSGIDVVIIQDGMGEQNWDETSRKNAEKYISAVGRAAKKSGAKTWIAIEVFKTERDAAGKPGKRVPGQISEIRTRIDRERPLADDLLFFDFFHYMSPARGAEQKALFEAYK